MFRMSVAFAFLLVASAHVSAQTDCSVKLPTRTKTTQSSICFFTSTYPDDLHVMLAADHWNNSCGGGEAIPSLNVGGCNGSPVVIDVVIRSASRRMSTRRAVFFKAILRVAR